MNKKKKLKKLEMLVLESKGQLERAVILAKRAAEDAEQTKDAVANAQRRLRKIEKSAKEERSRLAAMKQVAKKAAKKRAQRETTKKKKGKKSKSGKKK